MTREQKTKWAHVQKCVAREGLSFVYSINVEQAHTLTGLTVTIFNACVQNSSLDFLECIHSTQHTQERDGQTGRTGKRAFKHKITLT